MKETLGGLGGKVFHWIEIKMTPDELRARMERDWVRRQLTSVGSGQAQPQIKAKIIEKSG